MESFNQKKKASLLHIEKPLQLISHRRIGSETVNIVDYWNGNWDDDEE